MGEDILMVEQKRPANAAAIDLSVRSTATEPLAYSSFIPHPSSFVKRSSFILFLIALLPRTLGLADFFTTDEAYHWIDRVAGFSYAIGKGRWAETLLTGHPGVTIMWLGSLGQLLEQTALVRGWIGPPTPLEHLAWLRLPAATLEALLVPLAYLLLRRIVTPTVAVIAALLWATSPYLIAHSRLLHLDALLTVFVTLSVLALLAGTKAETRKMKANAFSQTSVFHLSAFVLSAFFAGLALLTKGPALILLPCVGLYFLWMMPAATIPQRLWRASVACIGWMGVAALTIVALWPALWVEPHQAITRYVEEITANGGRANGDGQFFLGRAVNDPGPLFYPVADLFRATPEMVVGLLLCAGWATTVSWRTRRNRSLASEERRQTHTALMVSCFICFWTLVMTIGPKKFDRYVLPTWPALLILAGVGLGWLIDLLAKRWLAHQWVQPAIIVLLAVLLCLPLLSYHPYYLSYYNPLLGGGAAAQRALLIGWGEGMEQVGAYLRTRPDIDHAPIASALGETLRPFVPVPVDDVTYIGRGDVNYAVVYLESAQRDAFPAAYAAIRRTVALQRITIHGIDYAEIYQIPRPFAQPLDAQFGTALHLWGVTVAQQTSKLTVTPAWDMRERLEQNYTLFIHLIDAQGNNIAQSDAPPAGDGPPTSMWQPGEQRAIPFDLFLPTPLAPGRYDLVLGLYDANGTRLPLRAGPKADANRAGSDALLVQTITVP